MRPAVLALVLTTAFLAPASPAGAGPAVALSASPSRISLGAREQTAIRLSNHGATPVAVTAAPGSYTLDRHGRPKVVGRAGATRDASRWLSLRPARLVVRPGSAASLTVTSRTPARAEPGDHQALVLLTSSSAGAGRVFVRMRVGVRVTVRAPGVVVRRLVVGGVRVRRSGRHRPIDVTVANLGNVTERLGAGRLTLLARGRPVARLRTAPRELLPRTRGVVRATYRGRWRGAVLVRIELAGTARTFRVVL